ncbi:hypothetical protein [Chitinasiproducens palmae]|uniref:Uncharacterized protein n=1 Tax=Chitinasiproducens palmae TaxID=1770053 RepID=A0A1H2PRT2_9BURK|nr:hypothetical protein [Chitinasiproducens palmae]SDV49216.1 hypothetical protein SAMN05216551_107159 [Chitinasiproducens palmae]
MSKDDIDFLIGWVIGVALFLFFSSRTESVPKAIAYSLVVIGAFGLIGMLIFPRSQW